MMSLEGHEFCPSIPLAAHHRRQQTPIAIISNQSCAVEAELTS